MYGTGEKITGKYKTGKAGEKFLKAELKLLANIGTVRTAEKIIKTFLEKNKEEHQLTDDEYDSYVSAYSKDTTWSVGGMSVAAKGDVPAHFKPDEQGIQVSAKHLWGTGKNRDKPAPGVITATGKDDLSTALRKQAVQLLAVKARAPDFEEKLL